MNEITIIGAGLIGMLTARELALAGARVRVLERGRAGREASWAGGGILSPLYPWRYPDALTELSRWSQARYSQLAGELWEETGIDPQWTSSGLLVLDIAEQEAGRAWADRLDCSLERLVGEALHGYEPALAPDIREALWLPEVAQVRNPRLLKALRRSLEGLGVEICEGCEVGRILVKNDRVRGVVTVTGVVPAQTVVLAGGAWSAALAAGTGLALEVAPVRGQMLMYRAKPGLLSRIILSEQRYVIPRRDGRILVGSTLEHVGFDQGTTEAASQGLQAAAKCLVPALAACPLERHWAGLRPGSPHGVPYIGPHPRLRGLFVNTGHYRNGVVGGPASARLVTDMVLGRRPILDPAPYRAPLGEFSK